MGQLFRIKPHRRTSIMRFFLTHITFSWLLVFAAPLVFANTPPSIAPINPQPYCGADNSSAFNKHNSSHNQQNYPNESAFAALKGDGSIASNNGAFAGLKDDGSISVWGDTASGDSGAPAGDGYFSINGIESQVMVRRS